MPKGSRIVMADDDKMLIDMYRERLELAGYSVTVCRNGEEALAKVRELKPDIALLDIMMPKLNGYETLASIKSDPQTKDIPVIMLSALMRDFNREKAVEAGADDYLIKSEAMPADVITKIEQVLAKYGKSTASPAGPNVGGSLPPNIPAPSATPPMAPTPPTTPDAAVDPMTPNPVVPGVPEPMSRPIEPQPPVASEPITPPTMPPTEPSEVNIDVLSTNSVAPVANPMTPVAPNVVSEPIFTPVMPDAVPGNPGDKLPGPPEVVEPIQNTPENANPTAVVATEIPTSLTPSAPSQSEEPPENQIAEKMVSSEPTKEEKPEESEKQEEVPIVTMNCTPSSLPGSPEPEVSAPNSLGLKPAGAQDDSIHESIDTERDKKTHSKISTLLVVILTVLATSFVNYAIFYYLLFLKR